MAFCQLDESHSVKHQDFFSSTEYKLEDCSRLVPLGPVSPPIIFRLMKRRKMKEGHVATIAGRQ